MTSGHTIVVPNETNSSAPAQLTMPVPLLSREIDTSPNEAYGHTSGTSRQGGVIRSGEHLISVPEYMEEQAFELLERDVILPQTDTHCHSYGASGQTGVNENCSSSLSSYEEMASSASQQRKDTEIKTSKNEAYGKINSSSGQGDVNKNGEHSGELVTSLHIDQSQNNTNDHSHGTSEQTADIDHNSSSHEEAAFPVSLQRKDIETLEMMLTIVLILAWSVNSKQHRRIMFKESTKHLH